MTASVRRAVRLEHRLTQPNASLADLDAAVTLALDHDLAALTVNPWLVKRAKRALGRWPRNAQASRLDGIRSSANTVATTPEVMCRSARYTAS